MDAKQGMTGVSAGGDIEQRSNVPASQTMKNSLARGSARQIIAINKSQMESIRRELPDLLIKIKEYDASAEKEIAHLEQAQKAALKEDNQTTLKNLKGLGRWVMDFANKVGATVVAKLIEGQLGVH